MITWKEEFSVNFEEIDNQHKRLFEIGSKIYDIIELNDNCDHYDEIMEILNELTDYTVFHFEYEENLLKNLGYTELEHQKFEHMFFVKKLRKLASKDIDKDQTESASDIAKFVIDWVSGHILKSDMKYKDFLKEKGII